MAIAYVMPDRRTPDWYAMALLDQALDLAGTITDGWQRSEALAGIARQLAAAGRGDALEAVDEALSGV